MLLLSGGLIGFSFVQPAFGGRRFGCLGPGRLGVAVGSDGCRLARTVALAIQVAFWEVRASWFATSCRIRWGTLWASTAALASLSA